MWCCVCDVACVCCQRGGVRLPTRRRQLQAVSVSMVTVDLNKHCPPLCTVALHSVIEIRNIPVVQCFLVKFSYTSSHCLKGIVQWRPLVEL